MSLSNVKGQNSRDSIGCEEFSVEFNKILETKKNIRETVSTNEGKANFSIDESGNSPANIGKETEYQIQNGAFTSSQEQSHVVNHVDNSLGPIEVPNGELEDFKKGINSLSDEATIFDAINNEITESRTQTNDEYDNTIQISKEALEVEM